MLKNKKTKLKSQNNTLINNWINKKGQTNLTNTTQEQIQIFKKKLCAVTADMAAARNQQEKCLQKLEKLRYFHSQKNVQTNQRYFYLINEDIINEDTLKQSTGVLFEIAKYEKYNTECTDTNLTQPIYLIDKTQISTTQQQNYGLKPEFNTAENTEQIERYLGSRIIPYRYISEFRSQFVPALIRYQTVLHK